MTNKEIRDCHYCINAVTNSPDDNRCGCFDSDDNHIAFYVQDSKKEAEECRWFSFCNDFPKLEC